MGEDVCGTNKQSNMSEYVCGTYTWMNNYVAQTHDPIWLHMNVATNNPIWVNMYVAQTNSPIKLIVRA